MITVDKFYGIDAAKQERIINAALKEFARSGYEKASTNEIVREADISKGSLFHYFNNKKELYLFLLDYVATVIDMIYEEVDWDETDLFERMKQLGAVKFRVYQQHPHAFDFLNAASKETSSEVKADIEKMSNEAISVGMEKSFKNIDFTKFRDDMDLEKMLNIISLTVLGLAEQQRKKITSFEAFEPEVLDVFDDYFTLLKRCFYREKE
jgi:TetR/AcrR family transcriptional regulator